MKQLVENVLHQQQWTHKVNKANDRIGATQQRANCAEPINKKANRYQSS